MPGVEATEISPLSHANHEPRWRLSTRVAGALCVVVGSILLTVQCATVPKGPVTCDGIQILSDELTLRDAEAYCRYAAEERRKVDAFWGATWTDPIRIHVSSAYRISRALVPGHFGNRGFMEMPLRRVRDNSGALLHEIVHIYAPNRNRFLAEGLASTCTRGWREILRFPTSEKIWRARRAAASGA
jgi:hypothetical protein